MALKYQTINEDRGARRAAELRRRFRHVSNSSINQRQFGVWSTPAKRQWPEQSSRKTQLNEFLIWSVLAAIVIFFGFVLF
jgi:hypothetical protein